MAGFAGYSPGLSDRTDGSIATSSSVGTTILTTRRDTNSSSAPADNYYATVNSDDTGFMYTRNRGYDEGADANKTFEVSPLWSRQVYETLATLSNIATNTTGYLYVDMAGYRFLSFDFDTSGTTPTDTLTITVEATNQDDGTAAASCFYSDVTQRWFNTANVVDADARWEVSGAVGCKYARVKYVTSNGGGNDADLTVYACRWW